MIYGTIQSYWPNAMVKDEKLMTTPGTLHFDLSGD